LQWNRNCRPTCSVAGQTRQELWHEADAVSVELEKSVFRGNDWCIWDNTPILGKVLSELGNKS
jgi:hypothetical protein